MGGYCVGKGGAKKEMAMVSQCGNVKWAILSKATLSKRYLAGETGDVT